MVLTSFYFAATLVNGKRRKIGTKWAFQFYQIHIEIFASTQFWVGAFLFSERGVLLEQNRERTGVELPYEQAAMNKEPMPEGLEFPDQIMYQGLRYLYAYYKMGWISLPHCRTSPQWRSLRRI